MGESPGPFSLFEACANERGWAATREEGGLAIRRGDASLRLRQDGGRLVLEITHGFDNYLDWMDLWAESSPGSAADVSGLFTLAEAIAYGLELMGVGGDLD